MSLGKVRALGRKEGPTGSAVSHDGELPAPGGALAELLACCLHGSRLGGSWGEVPPKTFFLKARSLQLWGSKGRGIVPKTTLRCDNSPRASRLCQTMQCPICNGKRCRGLSPGTPGARSQGVTQDVLNPPAWSHANTVKCCLPGKLIRDSVPSTSDWRLIM